MHQIEILAAIIKALLPFATGTTEQFDSLDTLDLGTLTGYDLFENACVMHYQLTHDGTSLPRGIQPGEYAKTI